LIEIDQLKGYFLSLIGTLFADLADLEVTAIISTFDSSYAYCA
jgi:hypothetical protein